MVDMPTPEPPMNRAKLNRLLSTCERHMEAARAFFDRAHEARSALTHYAARVTPDRSRVHTTLDRPLQSMKADELREAAADRDTCASWHVGAGSLRALARMREEYDRLQEASNTAQREARPWNELHDKLSAVERRLDGRVVVPRKLDATDASPGGTPEAPPVAVAAEWNPAPATMTTQRPTMADIAARLPSIEDLRNV